MPLHVFSTDDQIRAKAFERWLADNQRGLMVTIDLQQSAKNPVAVNIPGQPPQAHVMMMLTGNPVRRNYSVRKALEALVTC